MNFSDHLARLKAGVYSTYSLDDIPRWITEKTFLSGRRYSFKGHEFQLRVLSDTSPEVNVQKCSQIGMTEAQCRWSLGFVKVFPNVSLIYTMPFSSDAETLCKTRVDPIIADSQDLRKAMNPDLNNSSIKQVDSSFLYFRGTQGTTQAISIPADAIISDEIDRSSSHILSQYTSRLTHSAWKLRRNFSTPTIDGYGIAEKMKHSRRFRNICKCNSCNHHFVPDYYEHVKIPGFNDHLRLITKSMLGRLKWKEAKLLCPKCGKPPSLMPANREWVQENTLDTHEAAGYYVSPFDAPLLILPSDLVKASTEYARTSEFVNQNLGLTAEDAEDVLTRQELQACMVDNDLKDSGIYALGADMGLTCRVVIGRLEPNGLLVIVHREKVPLGNFEQRYRELITEYRCVIKVIDSLPYVDLVMRLQRNDANLYASVFVRSRNVLLFRVEQQKEVAEEGKLDLRQVKVNRDTAFDELVGHIKQVGMVIVRDQNEDEDFIAECLDLRRVQQVGDDRELHFHWAKSTNGNDHYFFALLYLFVAAKLRGVAAGGWSWPELVGTVKVVEKGPGQSQPDGAIMRYV
jgi:hypothetical protein